MNIPLPKATVRTISASEFKAKCLKLMDEVAQTGEPIYITKNGKIVAKLAAPSPKPDLSTLFGFAEGRCDWASEQDEQGFIDNGVWEQSDEDGSEVF